jgi:hypothetical protein
MISICWSLVPQSNSSWIHSYRNTICNFWLYLQWSDLHFLTSYPHTLKSSSSSHDHHPILSVQRGHHLQWSRHSSWPWNQDPLHHILLLVDQVLYNLMMFQVGNSMPERAEMKVNHIAQLALSNWSTLCMLHVTGNKADQLLLKTESWPRISKGKCQSIEPKRTQQQSFPNLEWTT